MWQITSLFSLSKYSEKVEDCDLVHLLNETTSMKKLSEIKPPLVLWLEFLKLFWLAI